MKITLGDKILIAALFVLNVGLLAVWGFGYTQGDWVVIDQRQIDHSP